MNLFNLPNSILIKIYEYDNTYQEILRKVLKTDLNKTIMDKHMKSLDIYENHILKTLTHKISLNPSNKIPYKDEIKISYMTEGRVNIYIKNLWFQATIYNKDDYKELIKDKFYKNYKFEKVGKKENLRYITM